MITSTDPKSNAMLTVLQMQRDTALEQVAVMAGELGEAQARIRDLQAEVAKLTPPVPVEVPSTEVIPSC